MVLEYLIHIFMYMRCYIYIHKRLDTNEVFYVGRGTVSKRASGRYHTHTFSRAYTKHKHNKLWMNITKKVEWVVEIIEDYLSWEESLELEKKYIKEYGRRDLNEGTLVNLTDGGEGSYGLIPSKLSIETQRKRMSTENNPMKQQHNKEKMSKIMKENNPMFNPDVVKMASETKKKYWLENPEKHPRKGIPREDLRLRNLNNNPAKNPEVKEKIRQAALLRNNKGGNNPSAKKVKHIESGKEYDSVIECQEDLNIGHTTIFRYLKNGKVVYL